MAEVGSLSRVIARFVTKCPFQFMDSGGRLVKACGRQLEAAAMRQGSACAYCEASLGGAVAVRCPAKRCGYACCRKCILDLAVSARRDGCG